MASAAFYYFFIPEMKGRSLEGESIESPRGASTYKTTELDELFENKVGVRRFRAYQTKIQEDAIHDVQINTGGLLEKSVNVSHVEEKAA
jgi:hypothetical protein